MAKVFEYNYASGKRLGYGFECPGCGETHHVRTEDEVPSRNWQFNGDVNKPTFKPSILVRGIKFTPEGNAMLERGEHPPEGQSYPHTDMVCHSFVTDGNIQFLGDCTHELKGKTVPLPEIKEV